MPSLPFSLSRSLPLSFSLYICSRPRSARSTCRFCLPSPVSNLDGCACPEKYATKCCVTLFRVMAAAIFALLFYERIKHQQQCPCQLFNVSLMQQQQQPQLRLGDCSLPWRICLTVREAQRIICSSYIKLMICPSVVCCLFSTKQSS